MPTLDELIAQQDAVTRAIAEHELPRHEEAVEVLAALAVSPAVARLTELAGELPVAGAKNALANVVAAINAAHGLVNANLPALRALVPPAAPEGE